MIERIDIDVIKKLSTGIITDMNSPKIIIAFFSCLTSLILFIIRYILLGIKQGRTHRSEAIDKKDRQPEKMTNGQTYPQTARQTKIGRDTNQQKDMQSENKTG